MLFDFMFTTNIGITIFDKEKSNWIKSKSFTQKWNWNSMNVFHLMADRINGWKLQLPWSPFEVFAHSTVMYYFHVLKSETTVVKWKWKKSSGGWWKWFISRSLCCNFSVEKRKCLNVVHFSPTFSLEWHYIQLPYHIL